MGGRGPAGQLLDLQEVADHAAVLVGSRGRGLLQRDGIVRPRTVDHCTSDQDGPGDPPGRSGRQHGLCAADIERPPCPGVGVRGQVNVGVHDHVHPGQAAGQGRVADVHHPPGHPGHVAAVVVDGHHPADPVRGRQPDGQRVAQALRRAGDRHHWPVAAFRGPALVVRARGRAGGPAQPSANLALSVTHPAALPDNVANVDSSILPDREP